MRGALVLFIMAGLYLLPSIVAFRKKNEKRRFIFLLNLLAGWTVLGWAVALVWAMEEERKPQIMASQRAEETAKQQALKRVA